MVSQLAINYKSALKLCYKCRVLSSLSNSERILDSMLYALPLFLQEQEWRFNHRYTGKHIKKF